MVNNNKQPAIGYNVIAAVLFAMQVVIDIIMCVYYAIRFENFRSLFGFIDLYNIICVAFAAVLLMGKKNIATAVVAGVSFLYNAYCLLRFFSLLNVIYFLAAAAVVFIVLVAVLPDLEQLRGLSNTLFFLPAALITLAFIISMIRYFHISLYTLGTLMYIGAILFLCLWFRSGESAVSAKPAPPPYIVPAGVSDEDAQILRNFRNLLEKKMITQEQFDAKEKEILAKSAPTEE